jgi:hypothetical protein
MSHQSHLSVRAVGGRHLSVRAVGGRKYVASIPSQCEGGRGQEVCLINPIHLSVRAVGGRLIRLDAAEATVMRERTGDGVTRGTAQTTQALWASLELHAIHHFTHAIAVDGSMRETVLLGTGG